MTEPKQEQQKTKSKLSLLFGDKHIIGLAGIKNSGKTNNLVYLICEYRGLNADTPVYAFGLPLEIMKHLIKIGIKEISSLKQLMGKKDCLLILDEFHRLKLNDRRYRDDLDNFTNFIYHNNVYVILCSPNLRDFNSIIGSVIERWALKTVCLDMCINGSQLKGTIMNYAGRFRSGENIEVPSNEILVVNDEHDVSIICDYVKYADTKKENKSIF